jgi:serine/threonine protein kinase
MDRLEGSQLQDRYLEGKLLKDRYLVRAQINQGGFANIYLALDLQKKSLVAIKQSNQTDKFAQEAMQEEAKLLKNISHQRLPKLYEYFAEDGRVCLVMDYIPGIDLGRLIEQGPRPTTAVVVDWVEQILEVLAILHSQERPIIHRDIKPSNLIYAIDGKIYLIDFGIAKGEMGTIMKAGTDPFSPPEQFERSKTTCSSDIYSLGVVLYWLLTHQEPPGSIALLLKSEELKKPSSLIQDIPLELEQVILKSMSLQVEQRYRNAQEMLDALQEARSSWEKRAQRANTYTTRRQVEPVSSEYLVMDTSEQLIHSDNLASALSSTDDSQRITKVLERLGEDTRFSGGMLLLILISLLTLGIQPFGLALSIYIIFAVWGLIPMLALLLWHHKISIPSYLSNRQIQWLAIMLLYALLINMAPIGIISLLSNGLVIDIKMINSSILLLYIILSFLISFVYRRSKIEL